jgi:hypothetical protein
MEPRSTRGLVFFLDRAELAWPADLTPCSRGALLHEIVARLERSFPYVTVRIGSSSNNNPWSESVQRIRSFVEREWPVVCAGRRWTWSPWLHKAEERRVEAEIA